MRSRGQEGHGTDAPEAFATGGDVPPAGAPDRPGAAPTVHQESVHHESVYGEPVHGEPDYYGARRTESPFTGTQAELPATMTSTP